MMYDQINETPECTIAKRTADSIGSKIAANRDCLIQHACIEVENKTWGFFEVKERCRIIRKGLKEILVIDGRQMIEFYPVTFKQTNDGKAYKITYELPYKKLY